MSRQSRLLSMVLRHKPQVAGITLDAAGWVEVDKLLAGVARAGQAMSRAELEATVAADEKRRFTLSPDGSRIRAAQGHSVGVDLGLTPSAPPPFLYHGTARRNLESIFAEGLRPNGRRHVHLSRDIETARKVGRRHGEEVVLHVDTAAMHAAGLPFWRADNGVWLTDAVPVSFLSLHQEDD